eukprot:TRINITY_DN4032_c0_g1_i1.p3 TRINITY_DN4032_c0_g1~~TRINITY_DN4032_c0_g1_i1.p3  ORF type:complete len:206 (+),score=32.40 TRINITY_DN4032_c0_g1_i1:1300-1917(+)
MQQVLQKSCSNVHKNKFEIFLVSRRRYRSTCQLQKLIWCQSGAGSVGRGDKQDAARKALEDALKGKRDILASNDPKISRFGRSGGGGDGRGGNNGGFFGNFNWGEFGDGFRKSFRGFFKTFGAILLFIFVFGLVAMIQPTMRFIGGILRSVLRLDGRPQQLSYQRMNPAQILAEQGEIGTIEQDVIAKYGADTEDVEYADEGDPK